MLTRIEIDGFKTFRDFAMDVPPFLVLLGRNASGKSNLFEALQFLRAASQGDLEEAADGVRGGTENFFHRYEDGTVAETARFRIDVVLPESVTDDFGAEMALAVRKLRYELTVSRSESMSGRLVLQDEAAVATDGEISLRVLARDTTGSRFVLRGGAGPTAFGGGRSVRPVLSVVGNIELSPHLVALRQLLASWRLFRIDPEAVRLPSSYDKDASVQSDGSLTANSVHQLLVEGDDGRISRGGRDLKHDLNMVIPEVVDMRVDSHDFERKRSLVFTGRKGLETAAASASDGTLRTLAMLAALHESQGGLICFEEPENGIHPPQLAKLLASFYQHVHEAAGSQQILVSSHMPVVAEVIAQLDPEALAFFELASSVGGGEAASRVTVSRGVPTGAIRPAGSEAISKAAWNDFLSGSQA